MMQDKVIIFTLLKSRFRTNPRAQFSTITMPQSNFVVYDYTQIIFRLD